MNTISILSEPAFRNAFEKQFEQKVSVLRRVVNVINGTGEIFSDVIPPQGRAVRYDTANNTLQNQVIDDAGNMTRIAFRRKRIETQIIGVQQLVSSQDLVQLKFDVRSQLFRVLSQSVSKALDYQILRATGRLEDEGATGTTHLNEPFKFFDSGFVSDANPGVANTVADRFANRFFGDDGITHSGDRSAVGATSTRAGLDPRDYSGTSATARAVAARGSATSRIGQIALGDIAEARYRIIARAKLQPNARFILIVNPITATTLLENDIIRNGFSETSAEALVTGRLREIMGCEIIETPILPPGGAVMMSSRAIAMGIVGSLELGEERILAQANALRVAAWVNVGTNLIYPEEVHIIHARRTDFALQRPNSSTDRFHSFFHGA